MEKYKLIVVEDVSLELKGTLSIIRTEIPQAEVVGTAMTEQEYWSLLASAPADLVLLDLGLGGSTTIGVDICRKTKVRFPDIKILIFTGELLNERLWVDALDAGADGIALKTGQMITGADITAVMNGDKPVLNQPIRQHMTERFKSLVKADSLRQGAFIEYEIDEYDERLLRHLALGYTKDMISELRTMPFSSKSLEKRQADLTNRLFRNEETHGINVTRLVVRAIELHIIDPANLRADQ